MGDAGSYLVGFSLAMATLTATFAGEGLPRHAVFAPLCVLAVPLYDTVTVMCDSPAGRPQPVRGRQEPFFAPAGRLGPVAETGRVDDLPAHGHAAASGALLLHQVNALGGGRDAADGRLHAGDDRDPRSDRAAESVTAWRRSGQIDAEIARRDDGPRVDRWKTTLLAALVALVVARTFVPEDPAAGGGTAHRSTCVWLMLAGAGCIYQLRGGQLQFRFGWPDALVVVVVGLVRRECAWWPSGSAARGRR